MAILMTATVPGLDAATYDQITAGIGSTILSAPGFRAHAAYPDADGWTVVEVWDSEANWREFFDANVRDHLPPEAEQSVTELHNVVLP